MLLFTMYGVLAAALTSFSLVQGQLSKCPQPALNYTAPHILPGFSLTKLTDGLKHPRQVVVDHDHNLIVSSLGDGIVAMGVSYDQSGCPAVKERKVLVPDNGQNFTHSVVLSVDAKTLFASTPNYVFAYGYDSATMAVTSGLKTIIKDMAVPEPNLSITRAMAIPSEFPQQLMVYRGEQNDTSYKAITQDSNGL